MIESVTENNIDEILPLIRQYQAFYKVKNISDVANRAFFSQFHEDHSHGSQFLFRIDDRAVGFATLYLTYKSSTPCMIGVMNDLFTVREARGKGVGRALIEHCKKFAIKKGAQQIVWNTAPTNKKAQILYDSISTEKSTWVRYAY